MRPPESTMQLEDDDDVVTPPSTPSANAASAAAASTAIQMSANKAPRGTLPLDVLEQVLDTVTAMRTQELTTYRRCDYLDSQEGRLQTVLDASWRQRIVEWMYGVVDHCSLRRDSVATASVYLDICVQRGLVKTREEYQLAAMTALQIAIKLCDSTVVKLQSMVALGRGLFTAQDVIDMERKMLATLNWNCHPPTSVCFLRQFLRLLPPTVPPYTRYMIAEVTRYVSIKSRFAKSQMTTIMAWCQIVAHTLPSLFSSSADSSPRSPCACTASSSILRQRWLLQE
jgi:Cyclin, N-terminal domain